MRHNGRKTAEDLGRLVQDGLANDQRGDQEQDPGFDRDDDLKSPWQPKRKVHKPSLRSAHPRRWAAEQKDKTLDFDGSPVTGAACAEAPRW